MKNFFYLVLIFGLGVLLLLACNNQKDAQSSEKDIPQGTWNAITMRGDTLVKKDFLRGMPSIIFRDSSLFSGTTGCNQYSARYTVQSGTVKIEMGAITEMACPGESESLFLKALAETNKVMVEERIMKFYNAETELLTFKKTQ